MKILAWGIILTFVLGVLGFIVTGLMSSNPITNILATGALVVYGVLFVSILLGWAIYKVFLD